MKNNFQQKTKIIFITGGVISGIGKGVVSSSIGSILKSCGYSVFMQKLDPYLNIDPGVLSPYEHGEVYVTNDGGETDLDLGHYERFMGITLTKDSNYTSGEISRQVFQNERKGKYNGKTVQIVPHFTNQIKHIINKTINKYKTDFLIVEIGGTVGDIESNAFLLAIAEYSWENKNNVFYVHTTYVPFLNTSKEFKTKPTQFSLSLLNSSGIKANMIILRSQNPIGKTIRQKIADFSFLPIDNVVSLHDVETIYEIPLYLESQKVAKTILSYFKLDQVKADMTIWKEFVDKAKIKNKKEVTVAMVGKYVELEDAYKSIKESLIISSIHNGIKVNFKWIYSADVNSSNVSKVLKNVDGVVILPGFGARGFNGKIIVANYTRNQKIPTLGICYGMQAMTINQAKLKGIKDATSSEISKKGTFILDIIEGKNRENIGGTLRLGLDKIKLLKNSLAHKIYGKSIIGERSRHRYEVNLKYVNDIVDNEFVFSGFHPESKLIEICELKNHPFYIGVQYHPEYSTKALKPHKLFDAFLKSIVNNKK